MVMYLKFVCMFVLLLFCLLSPFCVTSIYAAWHIGIASSSKFVVSSSVGGGVVVCRRHTLYSGQYLKNGLSDLIQIWHMDVTGPGGCAV